jgi:hypothetical protein
MKTFAPLAAAAFAVVAAAPAAHAQALVTQPYQTLIVQPGATVIIRPAAHPHVRHHVVTSHKIQDRLAVNDGGSLYNMAAEPVVQTAVAAPPVQTIAAPVVASGGPGLSGQFQCIAGCAGGSAGPAFVTQNGWDLNLVNEIGQPSRAWIDWPGHIWVQSWNEGAVYSTDGMTIQFDNGTVWAKSVILVVPPVR